eukprot:TRINITY_DN3700_c0_g3_i1.p1 TRINITY_DN3700_c0_g3~~TRINITY_DN3700_c0_g3_i1.p1  ORF type:complete len:410 (-),score=46.64 TRINITY_DN3700_c0_g3_i1:44-1273(-)
MLWLHSLRKSSTVACKFSTLVGSRCGLVHARTYLVVPSWQVEHFLSQKPNCSQIYGDHPLAVMSGSRRGKIIENVARSAMAQVEPTATFEDPDFGQTMDGRCRGWSRAEYDWKVDGRRVECKSAMLTWRTHEHCGHWGFTLRDVKLPLEGWREDAPFDDLVLALFSPRGVYIYAHDLTFGVVTQGAATFVGGNSIVLNAPKGECWSAALDHILNRLDSHDNSCRFILHVPLADWRLLNELQRQATHLYDTPHSSMSISQRGIIIQDIVRHVDVMINPTSCFKDPKVGVCINGKPRSQHNALYDWARDGIRVECKSSVIHFVQSKRNWVVNFYRINLESFDELLIAICAPDGIYIYRHDLKLGLGRAGSSGHQVQIYSKCFAPDAESALHDILAKLDASGCQRLAFVEFS